MKFSERSIATLFSLILVGGHILAIALVFLELHEYLPQAAEKLEIVLILSPITGVFAVAGVNHILSKPGGGPAGRKVTFAYSVVTLLLPAFLIFFICFTLISYPFGIASDLESLRITISSIEVALGAMVGAIANKLFGASSKRDSNDTSVSEE